MTKESTDFLNEVKKHLVLASPDERNEIAVQIGFTAALYGAKTVTESYEILRGSRALIDEARTAMATIESKEANSEASLIAFKSEIMN